MIPIGFDQTNGTVRGLEGNDDGGIAPPVADGTVVGFLQHVMGVGAAPRGSSTVDRDPSITAYSEEGAL